MSVHLSGPGEVNPVPRPVPSEDVVERGLRTLAEFGHLMVKFEEGQKQVKQAEEEGNPNIALERAVYSLGARIFSTDQGIALTFEEWNPTPHREAISAPRFSADQMIALKLKKLNPTPQREAIPAPRPPRKAIPAPARQEPNPETIVQNAVKFFQKRFKNDISGDVNELVARHQVEWLELYVSLKKVSNFAGIAERAVHMAVENEFKKAKLPS